MISSIRVITPSAANIRSRYFTPNFIIPLSLPAMPLKMHQIDKPRPIRTVATLRTARRIMFMFNDLLFIQNTEQNEGHY